MWLTIIALSLLGCAASLDEVTMLQLADPSSEAILAPNSDGEDKEQSEKEFHQFLGNNIFSTMKAVSERDMDESEEAARTQATIEAAVTSMHKWRTDAAVQESGCFALAQSVSTFSASDSEYQASAINREGLELVVRAMKDHSYVRQVQLQCATALGRLTRGNPGAAERAGGIDAVKAVVLAMRHFPMDGELQVALLGHLAGLIGSSPANAERARRSLAVDTMLEDATRFRHYPEVQSQVWPMLAVLLHHVAGDNFTATDAFPVSEIPFVMDTLMEQTAPQYAKAQFGLLALIAEFVNPASEEISKSYANALEAEGLLPWLNEQMTAHLSQTEAKAYQLPTCEIVGNMARSGLADMMQDFVDPVAKTLLAYSGEQASKQCTKCKPDDVAAACLFALHELAGGSTGNFADNIGAMKAHSASIGTVVAQHLQHKYVSSIGLQLLSKLATQR